jgi:hypothetical protein
MTILLILLGLCIISVFIPHNDKVYNFSWHTRLLFTLTTIYFISYVVYSITYHLTSKL